MDGGNRLNVIAETLVPQCRQRGALLLRQTFLLEQPQYPRTRGWAQYLRLPPGGRPRFTYEVHVAGQKTVPVVAYQRRRFGRLESVRKHWRSPPSR
jgi:hypothetical protein